jgi:hypothetical protein
MTYPEAIRTLTITVAYQRGINGQTLNLSAIDGKAIEIASKYSSEELITICEDKFRVYKVVHESFD